MSARAKRRMKRDFITLTGLRIFGYHGVLAEERRDGQDFVLDVSLELDTRLAATSDDVRDTVHYGELAEALAAVVAGPPVDLIETLCARLVEVCLIDPRVAAATVTVHKPKAPIPLSFGDVSVTVRRAQAASRTRTQRT
jgi:7,8-dihydroneopterin aldolase/epimerase/oxygenase